jgi:drug/metabolite transporter (DMT)-like permease
MKPTGQHYLLLHFIVLLWGFTSLLGTMLEPLTAMEVVFWRTLFAAAAMWLLFGKRYKATPLVGQRFWMVMLGGAVIGIHWFLFFLAARVGNVSSCLAGIATGSVWTALLEPVFERRRVRKEDLASALLVMIGLLIIFAGQADKTLGVVVGIASALFSALFGIFNRHFVQTGSDFMAVSTVGLTGAFATIALLMPVAVWAGFQPTYLPQLPEGIDWLWLAILVGACTVFALTVSVGLGRRFSAFSSSLAINMEPVYGIILARILIGQAEFMTTAFYIGTALILLAVLGHPLLMRRKGAAIAEVTGA